MAHEVPDCSSPPARTYPSTIEGDAALQPLPVIPFMWWFSRTAMAIKWSLGLGALLVVPLGWVGPFEIALFLVGYLATTVGVTVGNHRLFAHHSFEAKPPLRVALALLSTMAWQGSPWSWAGIHRRHHRHADALGDPHSPHAPPPTVTWEGAWEGYWHAHTGWAIAGQPQPWVRQVPDLLGDPVLRRIHHLRIPLVIFGLLFPAALGFAYHHTWQGAVAGLLWGGGLRIVVLEEGINLVNSLSHAVGPAPFATRDHSTNTAWLSFLLLGEAWHNNHHAFPASARHGLLRGQWDVGHWLIRAWIRLGWASKEVVAEPGQMAAKVKPEFLAQLPPAPQALTEGASAS